mmetsp:Transcript_102126/g.255931  ORF Transcript_102126/g.255931 Transcript_102126/m.255931 type:complete len:298 (-) Transcript_102126:311-1204(-)
MAAEAADTLGVPEAQRPAFEEVYAALTERAQGSRLSERHLKAWASELQDARAEVDVRAHLEANVGQLQALAAECAAAAGGDRESSVSKLLRQLEQRFVFMGVYAADVPLDGLMERLRGELQSMAARSREEQPRTGEAGSPCAFRLAPGVFDDRHRQLRKLAYPYTPACGSEEGSEVIECLREDGWCGTSSSTLVGYLAAHGKYADDVTVDPRCQGRGIGKALVCGWGTQLAREKEATVSLDVRACNYPALEMYKALGFQVLRKHYPGFYDWHGGFRLEAKTADLVARAPPGFDFSAL